MTPVLPPTQACNHMRVQRGPWMPAVEAYEVVCFYCDVRGLVTRELLDDLPVISSRLGIERSVLNHSHLERKRRRARSGK